MSIKKRSKLCVIGELHNLIINVLTYCTLDSFLLRFPFFLTNLFLNPFQIISNKKNIIIELYNIDYYSRAKKSIDFEVQEENQIKMSVKEGERERAKEYKDI